MASAEERIKQVASLMENLMNDNSIPKNIRKAVSDAKQKLDGSDEPVVKASSAIYLLDEVSQDINMPMHARTQIWTILSALETVKEG